MTICMYTWLQGQGDMTTCMYTCKHGYKLYASIKLVTKTCLYEFRKLKKKNLSEFLASDK